MPQLPILWLFGLPSSGKTTLACALRDHLNAVGQQAVVLDGDELRNGLCSGLGFSDTDRTENLRRAAEVAKLLNDQGFTVICAFITPKENHRELVRSILGDRVRLVLASCPLEICVRRDAKGLYRKAADKKMTGMTGTQDNFEVPPHCDLVLNTHEQEMRECCESLWKFLSDMQIV